MDDDAPLAMGTPAITPPDLTTSPCRESVMGSVSFPIWWCGTKRNEQLSQTSSNVLRANSTATSFFALSTITRTSRLRSNRQTADCRNECQMMLYVIHHPLYRKGDHKVFSPPYLVPTEPAVSTWLQ